MTSGATVAFALLGTTYSLNIINNAGNVNPINIEIFLTIEKGPA